MSRWPCKRKGDYIPKGCAPVNVRGRKWAWSAMAARSRFQHLFGFEAKPGPGKFFRIMMRHD